MSSKTKGGNCWGLWVVGAIIGTFTLIFAYSTENDYKMRLECDRKTNTLLLHQILPDHEKRLLTSIRASRQNCDSTANRDLVNALYKRTFGD